MKVLEFLGALGLCAACANAGAQDARAKLRPAGPVTVTADRAEFDKDGIMLYAGDVKLISDTLQLRGDRLQLEQFKGGQYTAQVTGAPAQLDHTAAAVGGGATPPAVSASANTLRYDTRTSVIDIAGKATMTRGKDQISGDRIRYNVSARRIEAAGGSGGQVRIVIQPPPPKPESKTP